MTTDVIIVAAGRGVRAGTDLPKQYCLLRGKPVLRRTVEAALSSLRVDQVRVVIHPEDTRLYADCVLGVTDPRLAPPVSGANTRGGSVVNGLAASSAQIVLIHDGARPLVQASDIEAVIDGVTEHGAAFLATPVADALWHVSDATVTTPQPRDGLWRAQTPQGFRRADILAAYAANDDSPVDDVAIARAYGLDVSVIEGQQSNLKITLPQDFALAEQLLRGTMDIRTGNGFDVHKFGAGDHVILNGVKVPHSQGLVGHSDADVALHTLTDAIFGALAEGDIGQWFPPSDPQWKGAASDIFLRKAVARAAERGFEITHLDCTIICEMPKIGPHVSAMRNSLAAITGIEVGRISVKATTTEQLGFAGRGEGIAAMATATLVAQ